MGWIADLLQEIPSAARYKVELEKMEKEVIALRAENQQLREQIAQRDAAAQKVSNQNNRLEEIKEKILLLVVNANDLTDQQIARSISSNPAIVTFHLDELRKKKMVTVAHTMGSSWTGQQGSSNWSITHDGRGYLISHGLIS